ncbi:MAG: RNA polymerase sigma factor [Bacteriovorax sp.]
MDAKTKTAEELMIIYRERSPEEAIEAFHELYRRFSQNVFSYLKKKLKNQADAEDLLQKVFLKIHESKHLYKEKYKFEQWLFVIARTSVLDHLRASSRYDKRLGKLAQEDLILEKTSDERSLDDLDLKEDQRELLEMKFIDELSYKEMSEALKKSETSLRKMVSRMVSNLRKGEQ